MNDTKNIFQSTRTAIAGVVVGVIALLAYFGGLFPEWQVPVIDKGLAEQLINALAIVGSALVVGFTVRKPGGGFDVQGVLDALIQILQAAGVIPTPPPQEEVK